MQLQFNDSCMMQQGFSKVRSSPTEQFEGFERFCGKASESAGEISDAALMEQRDRGVAQGGEKLRRVATGHRARIFAHGHVANSMDAVFNRPMIARDFQQLLFFRASARKTGDEAYRFNRRNTLDDPFAPDASDLFCAGKVDA